MKFLIPALIIAAVAAITYLIGRSVKGSHAKNEASQILWYGNDREYFIYEMLASAFPRKTIFRNLYCPVKAGDKTLYTEIDIVAVTHAGVVVIEVKGSKGRIDNPSEGEWCQRYKDKVMNFRSPYKQNEGHVRAVENILKRAGILKVPVFNTVVFADKDVHFSHRYKWLFKSDGIVDYVAELNDRFSLSRRDMNNIIAILSKYTRKRTDTLYAQKERQRRRATGEQTRGGKR